MPTKYDSLENSNEGLNGLPLVQRQLLALLRLALSPEPAEALDPCLAVCKVDWAKLYAEAEKQSVVGIAWAGIEKLPKPQLPNMDWLMEWLGQAEYIKTRNEQVNEKADELTKLFAKDGFHAVVLKGQANAEMYRGSKDLSLLRTSGDIDIWVMPKEDVADGRKVVIDYLLRNKQTKVGHIQFHHADYNVLPDVEIEVHFRPTLVYNYFKNKRLQEIFNDDAESSYNNWVTLDKRYRICRLTNRSNVLMQLVHMYRHVLFEGIGLRQMLDFYVLLVYCAESHFWPQEKIEIMQRIKELGLERFASAVMWVLGQVLEPETLKPETASWMLCEPNEKEGRFLLKEMMLGGNFGKYDTRYAQRGGSPLRNFLVITRKSMRMFFHYPSDCIWYTIYRLCQFAWRKKNHYQ